MPTAADIIDRSGGRAAAVTWSVDAAGVVLGDVETHLRTAAAAAARDGIAALTLDELTLAAVVASEDGNASAVTIACLADATLNRASRDGESIYRAATGGKGFGRQGARPMSTRLAPRLRHVRAACAVTRGDLAGVSQGAVQWLHWRTQDAMSRRAPKTNCPARVVVDRWCWARPWADVVDGKRTSCRLGPRKRAALEWVGPVDGVNAQSLLMFRPSTIAHASQWEAVQRILDDGRALSSVGAVVALGLVLAGGV